MEQLPSFVQSIAPFVNHYGYFAVALMVFLEGFGVPTPGQTTIIVASFYAGTGHLNIVLVFLIAFLAATIGDNIGFAIGHFGGEKLVKRYGKYILITHERYMKAVKFFGKHGGKMVAIARFVDGLRQVNGIIAGTSEMRWYKFTLFNAIGALIWVGVWAPLGYYGSSYINTFLKYELYLGIAIGVAILAFIIYKTFKYFKSKKLK